MKKLALKNIETTITIVLVVFFLFWMARRCISEKKDQMQPITKTEQTAEETPAAPTTTETTSSPPAITRVDTIVRKEVVVQTLVYVWVDSLKLRKEPYLTSSVLGKMPLNTPLTFLNEKTPFSQTITIGGTEYNEPWIKVKTPSGTVGWTYGGGVRAYQK